MAGTFEWPKRPIDGIERLILHWTAGERDIPNGGIHVATPEEMRRYHILVEHDEGPTPDPADDEINVLAGVPIERNAGSVRGKPGAHRDWTNGYAAHTRGFNSGSLGLSLCGMRGAVDYRPGGDVDPGPSPITSRQVDVMLGMIVQFLRIWGYAPTDDRVFTHWEAGAIHGRPQGGRWDIGWIPGHHFRREQVGPWIRRQVRERTA
jgi:hypothetical protein